MESAQHARRTPDGLLFLTDFFIFCTTFTRRPHQKERAAAKIRTAQKRKNQKNGKILRELEWKF